MHATIVGRTVLIEGPRYDFPKVLAAYEKFIDALATRFGAPALTTDRPEAQGRMAWPDPGKAVARRTWEQMKEMYDVVNEPLILLFEGFTIKTYLLGKTWCVRDAETGEVTTPEGEHVSRLEPAPTICVYGPRNDDGTCRLVSGDLMDRIGLLMNEELGPFGFSFERSTIAEHRTLKDGATDYAFIYLPHSAYGAGRDWINVQCVSSDGTELDPKDFAN